MTTAYKGFTPGDDGALICRDKTYREGETYTEDTAVLCQRGMHACLAPIDVLTYYPPATSVYHVVEVGDDASEPGPGGDSKVVTRKLTVGASIGIPGIVKAQVEYVQKRATVEKGGHATGTLGAASATGYLGAASATGDRGAASATGYLGAASATGYYSIAHADGWETKARGADGCGLTLAERDDNGALIGLVAVIVGREHEGQVIEPMVWYALRDGRVVQA